jgi:hypothetical protein
MWTSHYSDHSLQSIEERHGSALHRCISAIRLQVHKKHRLTGDVILYFVVRNANKIDAGPDALPQQEEML